MELQSWEWPERLSRWHPEDSFRSTGIGSSLSYSAYLLAVFITNPVEIWWMLWPSLSWKNAHIILHSISGVHESQFKKNYYARKFPHAGMLGCWAMSDSQPSIKMFACNYVRNSTWRSYRAGFAHVSQKAKSTFKHPNQRALNQHWNLSPSPWWMAVKLEHLRTRCSSVMKKRKNKTQGIESWNTPP